MNAKTKRPQAATVRANPETSLWQSDGDAFDKWFNVQAYSFGADPTWTQQAEMKRVWCIARKTLREGVL